MFRVFVFSTVVLIAGVLAENTTPSVIPPSPPPQPTAAPNNTNTTTTAPPTTAPPTTAPPTTAPPTSAPTTPKPAPSTTTPAPPTPTPDNKPGIWNVTDVSSNKTVACVVASMYINIMVPYVKVDKNSTINTTQEISVPSHANASGHCGNATQSLTLSWKVSNATLRLSFFFEKNGSEFTMSSVEATIPAVKEVFPDIAGNATTEFKLTSLNASAAVPVNQSYLCVAGVNFTMVDSDHKNATAVPTLMLKYVQFQAFASSMENKFDAAVDCAAVPYITPDIIPIFVGVALAALVAAVLVAYVIGRRRSAARGYLSM